MIQLKTGTLLLAGGEGSRLGFHGPKGCFPILEGRSLFELWAEQVKQAQKEAGRPLYATIMTSPSNDAQTRDFFERHHLFGLSPDHLSFFVQGTLPLLDEQGHAISQSAPDGNGHALLYFAASGLLKKWQEAGIEMLTVQPVDNPLAAPFDSKFIEFHLREKNEISVKCALRRSPEEKVGLVIQQGKGLRVVEYSEVEDSVRLARAADGSLLHPYANLGLFCFSLSFIERIVREGLTLPIHKAHKRGFWKQERFLFDWLEYTDKSSAIPCLREECFAPLKNASGEDSPETVRKALNVSINFSAMPKIHD